jgi:hypothetical protein
MFGADGRASEAGGRPQLGGRVGRLRPPTRILFERPQHKLTLDRLVG